MGEEERGGWCAGVARWVGLLYDGCCAMKRVLITSCLLFACAGAVAFEPEGEGVAFVHEATDSYTVRRMHGFMVRVSAAAMARAETTEPALALLEKKLAEVIELTPGHTHEHLRRVVFWVEHEAPDHPCACYHPGKQWLVENGFNADKEKGIEISNTRNFVAWTRDAQPLMVLHELAHAYHDLVLGFDHALVRDCYAAAKKGGKYDEVGHVSGETRRHYAMSNEREYFAELTESYFGKNDFAPFTRQELRVFDPRGYEMIEKLWFETGIGDEEQE